MRMKTLMLTGAGCLFLALGAIGVLLPIWPTTPFLLLCAACFSGTPQLHARVKRIPFFREHIENYASRAGLSAKTVGISLGYLWGMLLLSMFFVARLWCVCLLALVGAAVTAHILYMAEPGRGRERRCR